MPKPKTKTAMKKKKGAYDMAAPLPEGTVLMDMFKVDWRLGKSFAIGGFGLIYEVTRTKDKSILVMKLEPSSNGPLFCEIHFYQRTCKPLLLKSQKLSIGSTTFGLPEYITSGVYKHAQGDYRFLVMQKYGKDIHKLWLENGKLFTEKTSLTIAIKVLDSLEYMHKHDYVHADIKGSNLLIGLDPSESSNVNLVDFGLAYKYHHLGKHSPYKPDKMRKHDGTSEYTSRDSHLGVKPSRRGDLEILGYCILEWINGTLPWSNDTENKEYVAKEKNFLYDNLKTSMKKCNALSKTSALEKYFVYVGGLEYDKNPDYDYMRGLFQFSGYTGKLNFTPQNENVNNNNIRSNVATTPKRAVKVPRKRAAVDSPLKRAAKTATKNADIYVHKCPSPVKSPVQIPAAISTSTSKLSKGRNPNMRLTPARHARPTSQKPPPSNLASNSIIPGAPATVEAGKRTPIVKARNRTPIVEVIRRTSPRKRITMSDDEIEVVNKDVVSIKKCKVDNGTQTTPTITGRKRRYNKKTAAK